MFVVRNAVIKSLCMQAIAERVFKISLFNKHCCKKCLFFFFNRIWKNDSHRITEWHSLIHDGFCDLGIWWALCCKKGKGSDMVG